MFTTMWMALLVAPQLALANDQDEAACVGLSEGDACVRHNGDAGTCQPDDSDPSVLTCDDDPIGAGGSGSTGTTGGGDTGSAPIGGGECDGLSVGDPCVEEDGDAGWCKPDDSDPGELECDDDPIGTGGSGTTGGGTTGGTTGTTGTTSTGTTGGTTSTGTPTVGSDAGCAGLAEGDACVRDDGSAGVCQPDASDPTALECDDDGLVSARSVAGCSTVDATAAGWLALGGLGLITRRRRT